MPNTENLAQIKERMLAFVQSKGPALPVQISRMINQSPLFTSAFLSELYRESKLKMSNMRVGSSPLYYLEGQESQLEKFIEHLNNREREAFFLIRDKKILDDEAQTPVVRVALRAIKDFAVPIKVKLDDSPKLLWKYFQIPDSELKQAVETFLYPSLKHKKEKEEKKTEEIEKEIQKEARKEEEKKKEPNKREETGEPKKEEEAGESAEPKPIKKKKPEAVETEFSKSIKEYLLAKDIEILESILEKKKEFTAKIRIDMPFGKQEFYLIAKDKKKINEADLAPALLKAQTEKMPALIMAPGEIDKKSLEYAKEWRNLIKFEKLKL